MWNIDIENRVRDMSAEAENPHARLLDTMTETDDSAKSGRIALRRFVERCRQALRGHTASTRAIQSRPASVASGK